MSVETADLLIEIGCEELPPKSLESLAINFASSLMDIIDITDQSTFDYHTYATPRRIAVILKDIPTKKTGGKITQWGPPANMAVDTAGKPTPAALGFAKKCGVAFEQLENRDGKLCFSYLEKDSYTKDSISEVITKALHTLPIAKRMRWGANKQEFVRPIHWIVALFGDDVISDEVFGITPGRITYGHRFHHPDAIEIKHPNDYVAVLRNAKVEPSLNHRLDRNKIEPKNNRLDLIKEGIIVAAQKINGVVSIDESLCEEVAALVEWPVALTGKFDKEFLDVPHEALVSTMTGNQKYFPVFDTAGKLLPYFIFITNIESKDPAQIIAGNEKVIRPRFSDAKFFFEQDKQIPLERLVERLKTVVFQKELGTLHDKSARLMVLFAKTANALNFSFTDYEAAILCKADLITNMVSEFPELQGIMGKYYALHHGKSAQVAASIEEHYLPRFAGDTLPATEMGMALAVADRVDTLIGIFAIHQPPTGDKDPFALRRAALGILRILIENNLSLDLRTLFESAIETLLSSQTHIKCDKNKVVAATLEFVVDRLQNIYLEQGFTTEEFLVTRAQNITNPIDFDAHIKAIHAVSQSPEIKALASANKRIANILAKADFSFVKAHVNESLLTENAEKALFATLTQTQNKVSPLLANKSYEQIMLSLATLKAPVDAFFESVMVNAEDVRIRNNRLNLLQAVRNLFLSVADISLLSISK